MSNLPYGWMVTETVSTPANSCATTPTAANVTTTVGDQVTGGAYWTSWNSFDALGQPASQTQHALTSGGTDTTTGYTYGGSASSCPASSGPHTLAYTTGPGGTVTGSYCNNSLGQTTSRPGPAGTGQQTLAWDDQGRLSTVTAGSSTTTYVYDASGNVIERQDPGTSTLYLPGQQLSLNTGNNTVSATRFIALPGGGQVVESGTTANYRFELTDLHGTATVSLDSNVENPTWQQTTPYGAPRGTTPATWNDPNGYLNKPQDTSDGLTTLGARQYDPTLGRFISLDPVLETSSPQQLNGYTYSAANPITGSDPNGLFCDGCGSDYSSGPGCSFDSQGQSNGSCDGQGTAAPGCAQNPQCNSVLQQQIDTKKHNDDITRQILAAEQQCGAKGGTYTGGKCLVPVKPKPHHWWDTVLAVVAVVAVVAIAVACIVQPELIPAIAAIAESGATAFASGGMGAALIAATATAVEVGATAAGATTVAAFAGGVALAAGGGSTISDAVFGNRTAGSGGTAADTRDLAPVGPRLEPAPRGTFSQTGTNAAGGKIFTSDGEIVQEDFTGIVSDAVGRGDHVHILTGTHGAADGTIGPKDPLFLSQDSVRFGDLPNVHLHNVPVMSQEEISGVLQSSGTIIGAFCYSETCLSPYM